MQVRVNPHICQGHSMCTLACPEIFALNNEDGHAYVIQPLVPKELEENVDQAVRSCPEQAIEVY